MNKIVAEEVAGGAGVDCNVGGVGKFFVCKLLNCVRIFGGEF